MDLYQVLGVRRSSSVAEIRRAYQKLARRFHPDLNPGDPVARDRFRAIAQAFEVLADAHRRGAYDRGELPASAAEPVSPEVGFEGFDFTAEVRAASGGFREIFDGVLQGAPAQAAGARRGEDLEQPIRIGFEESLSGTRRRVHLVRLGECPVCAGAGEVAHGPVACPRCHGTGRLRSRRGHMVFSRRCADCGATGTLSQRACARCGGEGRLMQSESLELEIPAGVAAGSTVRLPGAGNAGARGGPAGDLVLAVEVEPHPFYRREGDDLVASVPVTIVEAALGGHIQVPTPDGPLAIELPAGTQAGQRFRLRKRGAPRPAEGARGDLYVEVRIVVPRVDDARGRELLRELAQLHPEDPRRELLQRPAGGSQG